MFGRKVRRERKAHRVKLFFFFDARIVNNKGTKKLVKNVEIRSTFIFSIKNA